MRHQRRDCASAIAKERRLEQRVRLRRQYLLRRLFNIGVSANMTKPYGAVTGLGIVTPFGATHDDFWRGLLEAPDIFSTRTLAGAWSPEPVSCYAGWIDDGLPQIILGTTSLRSLSRESRFALAAAVAALRHAD